MNNNEKEQQKMSGSNNNRYNNGNDGNNNIVIDSNQRSGNDIIKHLEVINSINLSSPRQLPPSTSSEEKSFSCFDKVNIPPQFVGKSFRLLFRSLFEVEGAIAIALYRYPVKKSDDKKPNKYENEFIQGSFQSQSQSQSHSHSHSQNRKKRMALADLAELPIVLTSPDMATILLLRDEVFILRATHKHL